MHETCKQIFKGHIYIIMPTLMTFFLFSFKTILVFCLLFLLFSSLHLAFTIFTYWYFLSIWETNWEVLQLVKLEKPCFMWNF